MFATDLTSEKDIAQSLSTVFWMLILAGGVNWYAQKKNYYQYPKAPPIWKGAIPAVDVLGAFLIFLGFQIILMPYLVRGFISLYRGSLADPSSIGMSPSTEAWSNVASMVLTFFLLFFYTRLIGKERVIWNRHNSDSNQIRWDFILGVLTWFISFPLVTAISEMITTGIVYLYGLPPVDQAAVKYLKNLSSDPLLFWTTGIVMMTIIPATEELLFRGFLQNWLVGKYGRVVGIISTALIFAVFHMSPDQGYHNLDVVVPLFILACYLGFLYERQQTLWAPIGLHATFNFISLLMLSSVKS